MLDAVTVRLLSFFMTAMLVVVLAATFRWERRAGAPLRLRVSTGVPRGILVGWPIAQAVILFYPILVAALPSITYETFLNFSFPLDSLVQLLGFLLWVLGAIVLLWSSRLLGPIMTIDGIAEGHELVTQGPYAVIRHPTYAALVLLALGATALFLSYVLLVAAILTILMARSLARREEEMLGSKEGFGEEYRLYMHKTGRFLPRVGFRRRLT